jgi:GTPase SAR1 family protein
MMKMLFMETSAKTSTNVDALFKMITKDMIAKKLPLEKATITIDRNIQLPQ